MIKTWSPLYKLTNGGKIQTWSIGVAHEKGRHPIYTVIHGQLNGKLQSTSTEVKSGKNIGKSNETSPLEQCILEADSLWTKQRDRKGYSESIPEDKPFRPMLAHSYKDYSHKVKWPAILQPKLDGCVDGDTILQTKEYGLTTIRNVVDNKLDCHVLSMNKNGKSEYKKVLYHFKNKEISENITWFEIELTNGQKLKLTGNHPVYLPRLKVYRRVDELENDELVEFLLK